MLLWQKILLIVISPMIVFGGYLMIGGFIGFHTGIGSGYDFVFVGDKYLFITVLVIGIFVCLLFALTVFFVKKIAPAKHAELQSFFGMCFAVIIGGFFILTSVSAFTDEMYFEYIAQRHDYVFCAKQRGGNKSSDVLLFARTDTLCEEFRARNIRVREFRKELGRW